MSSKCRPVGLYIECDWSREYGLSEKPDAMQAMEALSAVQNLLISEVSAPRIGSGAAQNKTAGGGKDDQSGSSDASSDAKPGNDEDSAASRMEMSLPVLLALSFYALV